MILIVRYIGTSDVRILREADLEKHGIKGSEMRWDRHNNWEVQLRASGAKAQRLEDMLRGERHFAISTLDDERKDKLVVPAEQFHTASKPGTRLVDGLTGADTIVP